MDNTDNTTSPQGNGANNAPWVSHIKEEWYLDPPGSVIGLLERAVKQFGDLTALRTEGSPKQLSYGDLWQASIITSSRLLALGVKAAESVAILSENRPEWAVAYFGITAAGAIPVLLDTRLKEKELAYIVNDSGAVGILFSERNRPLLNGLRDMCCQLRLVVPLDEEKDAEEHLGSAGLKIPVEDFESRNAPLSEDAVIIYTSGTMGPPKGVELTHSNLLFEVKAYSRILSLTPGDRVLSFLPLHHAFELVCGLLGPLHCGAAITYLKDSRPSDLVQALARIKPKVLTIVPLIANQMYEDIRERLRREPLITRLLFYGAFLLSGLFRLIRMNFGKMLFRRVHEGFGGSLQCLICGGAPLDIKVAKKFDLMGVTILEGYGLTETSPTISVNTFGEKRIGSVGKPIPGVEVRIMKDNQTDAAGEILTRGPHVMKGYLHDAQRTPGTIRNGWFHTGDIGYLDREGYLFVTGRLKNVIVTATGKKVQSEEVENMLLRNPLIREVCVVGRRIAEGLHLGGEEVYAVVVPDLDRIRERYGEITDSRLRQAVAEAISQSAAELAGYKRITGFEIWKNELPRTSTKKIRRGDVLNSLSRIREQEIVIRR